MIQRERHEHHRGRRVSVLQDEVLSSDFEFHIPDYQRPYAWIREQASELFDDIWRFMQEEGARRSTSSAASCW